MSPPLMRGGWSASRHFSIENSRRDLPEGDVRGRISVLELMHRVVTTLPETREPFWRVFTACARDNLSPSGLLSRSWCFIFISGRSRD
jgi:hypothetical protein